jgi:hypothetical protein
LIIGSPSVSEQHSNCSTSTGSGVVSISFSEISRNKKVTIIKKTFIKKGLMLVVMQVKVIRFRG